ncbi:MAG: hypothetical protein ABI120_13095, partial [Gemmatimonadaceae bacterium]
ALGFGFGDVVLGELLRERGKLPAFEAMAHRLFIVAGEGVTATEVLTVASNIRRLVPELSVSYGLNRTAIESRRSNKQADDGRAAGANIIGRLDKGDRLTFALASAESSSDQRPLDATLVDVLLSTTAETRTKDFSAGPLAGELRRVVGDHLDSVIQKRRS